MTDCGALLYSRHNDHAGYGSAGAAEAGAANATRNDAREAGSVQEHFVLHDSGTGKGVAGLKYKLTTGEGRTVEGETDDDAILAARGKDQRNLLASLLLARGTPMLSMGAELGQTQAGNNNAYAQDNETAWLDWSGADRELLAFTQKLIALRKNSPALTRDSFLAGAPLDDTLIPESPVTSTWPTRACGPEETLNVMSTSCSSG